MAFEPISQRVNTMQLGASNARLLQLMLTDLANMLGTATLNSAGIVISSASAVTAKTSSSVTYYLLNGTVRSIAASTTLTALPAVGSGGTAVTTGLFSTFAWYVDNNGTITCTQGVIASTLATATLPIQPPNTCLIGFITVAPNTVTFTPNVTALDAANTNVTFQSPVGPCFPNSGLLQNQ
jgi:hypothetical protein